MADTVPPKSILPTDVLTLTLTLTLAYVLFDEYGVNSDTAECDLHMPCVYLLCVVIPSHLIVS